MFSITGHLNERIMENQKIINTLRKFFTVSVAAFEFQMQISSAFGHVPNISPMHQLHRIAKAELEKENPSLDCINVLLIKMENLADLNNKG